MSQGIVTVDTPRLGFHYSSPYPDAMEPFVAIPTAPTTTVPKQGWHCWGSTSTQSRGALSNLQAGSSLEPPKFWCSDMVGNAVLTVVIAQFSSGVGTSLKIPSFFPPQHKKTQPSQSSFEGCKVCNRSQTQQSHKNNKPCMTGTGLAANRKRTIPGLNLDVIRQVSP